MRSYEEDERYYFGENSKDTSIYVKEIVSPGTQFDDDQFPYSHVVKYDEIISFYALNDSKIMNRSVDSLASSPTGEGDGLDSNNMTTLDNGRYQYEDSITTIIVDSIYRTTYVEKRDSMGNWQRRTYKQFSKNDTIENVPIVSLTTSKRELPSGDCVYRVKQYTHHEIYVENSTVIGGANSKPTNTIQYGYNNNITLYPNPVQDELNIVIENELEGSLRIDIIELGGKVVENRKVSHIEGNVIKISTGRLASGIYLVRLINQEGNISIEKFIKK